MTIPVLNSLWRITPRDDRELIRSYAGWPLSVTNLTELTAIQVQRWIDEIENLEADYAEKVEIGTAHLGNAASYEGPTPGETLSRDDLKKKADVLEWDTSLLRVKYESGGAGGTAGAVLGGRMESLKGRIFQALGIQPVSGSGSGITMLVRS
jgi:hypothetical protein